jgi:hypothetical protein
MKQLAVDILADQWAGADVTPGLIALANAIRAAMRSDGTWEGA